MRRTFAEAMFTQMELDESIHILTADLGFGMWDKIKNHFPDRFHNFGAAEQLTVGAAVGMALSGRIPVVYSITPFLLYRPFEWVRNYLSHEGIPVKLVGSGRDKDYAHDGFTHWAEERGLIESLIKDCHYPGSEAAMLFHLDEFLHSGYPSYLNLRR